MPRPQPKFRVLSALNAAPQSARTYRAKHHGYPSHIAQQYLNRDRPVERVVHHLLAAQAVRWKELLEALEFHGHVRRSLRRAHVVELCCGHGLVGMLFALLDRRVERVTLIDHQLPPSLLRTLDALSELGPWVAEKVECLELSIDDAATHVPPDASVVAAHACGGLTDQCLSLAMERSSPVAVMPCCVQPRSPDAPRVLELELGAKRAVDVDRTYRLTRAGYDVVWRYLPEEITPMNRVIIGRPLL